MKNKLQLQLQSISK